MVGMELKIELAEVYSDGQVSDAILNAVADRVYQNLRREELLPEVERRVQEMLTDEVHGLVAAETRKVLDEEFDVVGRWGERSGKSSLRQEIRKEVKEAVTVLAGRSASNHQTTSAYQKLIGEVVREMMTAEVKEELVAIKAAVNSAYKTQMAGAISKVLG